jgi:pyruvate-formate lyase-activating enzyme
MENEKNLSKVNNEEVLKKRLEKLEKRNKKLRGVSSIIKEFGDDPDEIRLKLNQIYDWNEKK